MPSISIYFEQGKHKSETEHYSPLHVIPFPVYPLLQAQLKDPFVLVQVASLSQLSTPSVHSSISIKK